MEQLKQCDNPPQNKTKVLYKEGQGFDGLSYHVVETVHSRGCKEDRRVSTQYYGMCHDGSKERGSSWVQGPGGHVEHVR
jgi:hypothetical protein